MTHAADVQLRARIARYLLHHTPKETAEHFGFHLGTIYRIMREFGVQRVWATKVKRRTTAPRRNA